MRRQPVEELVGAASGDPRRDQGKVGVDQCAPRPAPWRYPRPPTRSRWRRRRRVTSRPASGLRLCPGGSPSARGGRACPGPQPGARQSDRRSRPEHGGFGSQYRHVRQAVASCDTASTRSSRTLPGRTRPEASATGPAPPDSPVQTGLCGRSPPPAHPTGPPDRDAPVALDANGGRRFVRTRQTPGPHSMSPGSNLARCLHAWPPDGHRA